jgi:hypothetical protein
MLSGKRWAEGGGGRGGGAGEGREDQRGQARHVAKWRSRAERQRESSLCPARTLPDDFATFAAQRGELPCGAGPCSPRQRPDPALLLLSRHPHWVRVSGGTPPGATVVPSPCCSRGARAIALSRAGCPGKSPGGWADVFVLQQAMRNCSPIVSRGAEKKLARQGEGQEERRARTPRRQRRDSTPSPAQVPHRHGEACSRRCSESAVWAGTFSQAACQSARSCAMPGSPPAHRRRGGLHASYSAG